MIKKDKSVYLNYVQDIKTKVDGLCAKVAPGTASKDVEKLRVRIFAKIALLTQKAAEDGLIPNADWVRYKKEIDELYNSLSEAVQEPLVYNKPRANTR